VDAREIAFDAVLAWAEGRVDQLDQFFDRAFAPDTDPPQASVASSNANPSSDPQSARPARTDPRDQGLARELALGAVRWLRLYDHLAGRFLRPGPQPEALLVALRIGCHQLFALDRVPPHAAVDASVALLARARLPRLTGVANAVLRRLAALRQPTRTVPGPAGRLASADHPEDPAVLHSLPDLLLRDLHDHLPEGPPDLALGALNLMPHLCTRWRPGRPTPRGTSVLRREDVWTWWGDPREALAGPVADGLCVVQDRTQGEPVRLGAPRAGDLVLDCCAAPGGKALALADLGCRVVAADVAPAKVAALDPALARLAADGRRPALAAGAFAVVFVDAPCSNSGVIGRRPEARWRYRRDHLDDLGRIQRALLAAAAPLVAPGGRLVYSTCSISPRENQAVAHGLDGWRLRGEQRTWPDQWRGGGYVAVLVRSAG
jgi:16S rRNA (cytosine967-C5)-methyltransferase